MNQSRRGHARPYQPPGQLMHKWGPKEDLFEQENRKRNLEPPPDQLIDTQLKFDDEYNRFAYGNNNGADKRRKAEINRGGLQYIGKMHYKNQWEQEKWKVNDQFTKDFMCWILGKDPSSENHPAFVKKREKQHNIYRKPGQRFLGQDIDEWLGKFIDKKAEFMQKVNYLKLGPNKAFTWTLNHYWLFYKYILRGLPYPADYVLSEFDTFYPDLSGPRPSGTPNDAKDDNVWRSLEWFTPSWKDFATTYNNAFPDQPRLDINSPDPRDMKGANKEQWMYVKDYMLYGQRTEPLKMSDWCATPMYQNFTEEATRMYQMAGAWQQQLGQPVVNSGGSALPSALPVDYDPEDFMSDLDALPPLSPRTQAQQDADLVAYAQQQQQQQAQQLSQQQQDTTKLSPQVLQQPTQLQHAILNDIQTNTQQYPPATITSASSDPYDTPTIVQTANTTIDRATQTVQSALTRASEERTRLLGIIAEFKTAIVEIQRTYFKRLHEMHDPNLQRLYNHPINPITDLFNDQFRGDLGIALATLFTQTTNTRAPDPEQKPEVWQDVMTAILQEAPGMAAFANEVHAEMKKEAAAMAEKIETSIRQINEQPGMSDRIKRRLIEQTTAKMLEETDTKIRQDVAFKYAGKFTKTVQSRVKNAIKLFKPSAKEMDAIDIDRDIMNDLDVTFESAQTDLENSLYYLLAGKSQSQAYVWTHVGQRIHAFKNSLMHAPSQKPVNAYNSTDASKALLASSPQTATLHLALTAATDAINTPTNTVIIKAEQAKQEVAQAAAPVIQQMQEVASMPPAQQTLVIAQSAETGVPPSNQILGSVANQLRAEAASIPDAPPATQIDAPGLEDTGM